MSPPPACCGSAVARRRRREPLDADDPAGVPAAALDGTDPVSPAGRSGAAGAARTRCLPLALAATLAAPLTALAAPCPAGMPVAGPLSSGFGARHGGFHAGVDIRAPAGTPVVAAVGGTVVFAGRYFAYGLMVEIEHPDGTRARYAHLAGFARGIRAGTPVVAGQQIGAVGRTGRTTGANLHVELRRAGRPVDPWPWLSGTDCVPPLELADMTGLR